MFSNSKLKSPLGLIIILKIRKVKILSSSLKKRRSPTMETVLSEKKLLAGLLMAAIVSLYLSEFKSRKSV